MSIQMHLYKYVPDFCWKPTEKQLDAIDSIGALSSDEHGSLTIDIGSVLIHLDNDDNDPEIAEMLKLFEETEDKGTVLRGSF